MGKTPLICVWDPKTMKKLAAWQGCLNNGIACLAFSPKGDKLAAAAAIDVYHSVVVLDVKGKIKKGGKGLKGGVLGKSKGPPDPILDMAWHNDTEFATCGVKNYCLWTYSKKAKFKKPRNKIKRGIDNTLLCMTFDKYKKRFLVGTKKGNLQVWVGDSNQTEVKTLHFGLKGKKKKEVGKPVDAIYATEK